MPLTKWFTNVSVSQILLHFSSHLHCCLSLNLPATLLRCCLICFIAKVPPITVPLPPKGFHSLCTELDGKSWMQETPDVRNWLQHSPLSLLPSYPFFSSDASLLHVVFSKKRLRHHALVTLFLWMLLQETCCLCNLACGGEDLIIVLGSWDGGRGPGCVFCFCFFWDKVSLCSAGWP